MGRALDGASTAGNMTAQACLDYCTMADFGLAGLEYGNECFCGNTLKGNSTYGQTGCDLPCSGDSSQVCGGANRLTVYSNSAFVPPSNAPKVGVFALQGCFTEGKTERLLSGYSFASANMTVDVCVDTCQSLAYVYAGVEYSTECYCADTLSNQTTQAPPMDCEFKCGGNKKQFCGGADRVLLYARNETAPTRRRRLNRLH
ncbi:WSC domain-containing protein [Tricharina praecox]|uniref:WSC domain-containing protein n=1 Tax=Tricharina praecox TaxID=43433 RepID=UPI00221F0AC6|nr:WSC domain-containing protein [Tricharina praecox]KAI5845329.1 WSC domain-containing protein [Tricharina praecox]